ncbi:hypothetical protein ACIQWA_31190 [Kitasatospora sp. NPDC098652]|uniref:hypothetical protein n=1 Tax=Kitasatospora sp. NPDC098652 TaxID=3364095 RepID=UPI0038194086
MRVFVLLTLAPYATVRVITGPIAIPAPDPWGRWRRWVDVAAVALATGSVTSLGEYVGRVLAHALG